MYSSLMPFTILGVVLGLGVLSLAIWRWIAASHEDDTLHVLEASYAVPRQSALAHKLDVIDKWGEFLTIVTVVYAIILAIMYARRYWEAASRFGMS